MTNAVLSNHPKQFKRKRLLRLRVFKVDLFLTSYYFFHFRLWQQDRQYRENLDDGDTLKVVSQIGTKNISHKATW